MDIPIVLITVTVTAMVDIMIHGVPGDMEDTTEDTIPIMEVPTGRDIITDSTMDTTMDQAVAIILRPITAMAEWITDIPTVMLTGLRRLPEVPRDPLLVMQGTEAGPLHLPQHQLPNEPIHVTQTVPHKGR